jgi:hypothetical protein
MKEVRFGNWLPLLIALTAAVEGWFMLGPLAQMTLTAAAVLKRLKGASIKRLGGRSDTK